MATSVPLAPASPDFAPAPAAAAASPAALAPAADRRALPSVGTAPATHWHPAQDALWQGRLPLWQPARRRGYRFNLDSVLLAGFVAPRPEGHAIDLGAGCGILGLMLLALQKARTLTAVERQPQLAAMVAANVATYAWQARVQLCAEDLRHAQLPPAQTVVFNPPYYAAAASRPGTEPGRDAGRRECFGVLGDFVRRAAEVLDDAGELAAIVPYSRADELRTLLARYDLAPTRQRRVQAHAQTAPRHLLLAASRGTQACTWLAPLVVHDPRGRGGYAAEVAGLIDGPAAWRRPPGDGAGPPPSAG